jgi:gliding motility-associated-like protein
MNPSETHIDPLESKIRELFDDQWLPDIDPAEIAESWSNIKSQGIGTPARHIFQKATYSVKNLIIASVSTAVVVTAVFLVVHSGKDTGQESNTIPGSEKVLPENHSEAIPSDTISKATFIRSMNENQKGLSSSSSGAGNSDDETSSGSSKNEEARFDKILHCDAASDEASLAERESSALAKTADDPDKIDMKITFHQNKAPEKNEIVISDSVFCQGMPLNIAYNAAISSYSIDVHYSDQFLKNLSGEKEFICTGSGTYVLLFMMKDKGNNVCNKSVRIRVLEKPLASFTMDQSETPVIRFMNRSLGAVKYLWHFGDTEKQEQINPIHEYQDTGNYRVTLIASNRYMCRDTFYKTLNIARYSAVFIPNVITPNNDGRNDVFEIAIQGEEYFHLTIMDNKYKKIFQTENKNEVWEGTCQYDGSNCPSGVYYYFLEYKFQGQEKPVQKRGTIQLIR